MGLHTLMHSHKETLINAVNNTLTQDKYICIERHVHIPANIRTNINIRQAYERLSKAMILMAINQMIDV